MTRVLLDCLIIHEFSISQTLPGYIALYIILFPLTQIAAVCSNQHKRFRWLPAAISISNEDECLSRGANRRIDNHASSVKLPLDRDRSAAGGKRKPWTCDYSDRKRTKYAVFTRSTAFMNQSRSAFESAVATDPRDLINPADITLSRPGLAARPKGR